MCHLLGYRQDMDNSDSSNINTPSNQAVSNHDRISTQINVMGDATFVRGAGPPFGIYFRVIAAIAGVLFLGSLGVLIVNHRAVNSSIAARTADDPTGNPIGQQPNELWRLPMEVETRNFESIWSLIGEVSGVESDWQWVEHGQGAMQNVENNAEKLGDLLASIPDASTPRNRNMTLLKHQYAARAYYMAASVRSGTDRIRLAQQSKIEAEKAIDWAQQIITDRDQSPLQQQLFAELKANDYDDQSYYTMAIAMGYLGPDNVSSTEIQAILARIDTSYLEAVPPCQTKSLRWALLDCSTKTTRTK